MDNVKVGFSRICITPPLGTVMFGFFEPRFVNGIYDDLYASAIAFDSGRERVVVIALDLCGCIHKEWVDTCKKMIAEYCNIPVQSIILTCSHTHTGPALVRDTLTGEAGNAAYDKFLMLCMRDAAYNALANVCESKFFIAENTVKDVAFCRIYRMKDGQIKSNPGVSNPDILYPIAEPYEKITVIKIAREYAEDVLLVNYGVHADTIGGDMVSADWPGYLRETLERVYPDTVCVFLQGCEGDVNTTDVRWKVMYKNISRAQKTGRKLAGAVVQVLDDAKEVGAEGIEIIGKTVSVPTNQENHRIDEAKRIIELHKQGRDDEFTDVPMDVTPLVAEARRIVSLENGPEVIDIGIQALRIGELAFISLPGEPFVEIGKRILKASPFEFNVVAVLNGCGEQYFPTSTVMAEGSYESKTCALKAGADNIIVEETIKLLEEIK